MLLARECFTALSPGRHRMLWTVRTLVLYLGIICVPSPASGDSYNPIESSLRSSTSLMCHVQKYRSRIEAAVVCHGDVTCRATWTPLQRDVTTGFAWCSCMTEATFGGMDDGAWRLRLQHAGTFNTEPVMRFPMDVINGNRVLGTLDGTLEGGVSLGAGIQGKAIYLDGLLGSRVNYGVHTASEGCFFDPGQCGQGITISLWVKLEEVFPAITLVSVLDNGGCRPQGIGFCMYSWTQGNVDFAAVDRFQAYIYSVKQPPISQWHLWVFTYISGDIKQYINGCGTEPYANKQIVGRKFPYAENAIFHLGDSPVTPGAYGPRCAIDELMVWYKVLTEEEIWALYVQGGQV